MLKSRHTRENKSKLKQQSNSIGECYYPNGWIQWKTASQNCDFGENFLFRLQMIKIRHKMSKHQSGPSIRLL